MAIIISVGNQKGGAGKTTTAVNLAAAFAERKKKVLLIDGDHQSASTSHLLVPKEENCALSAALIGGVLEIKKINDKYDLISSTVNLSDTANALNAIQQPMIRNKKLKQVIDTVKDKYDYVIIDCPPAWNSITFNALWASDYCLIPARPDEFHLVAIEDMIEMCKSVQENGGKIIPLGILLVSFDRRGTLHNHIAKTIVERYGEKMLFNARIRNNINLQEMITVHKDIFEYNCNCNGAIDYMAVALEIEKKIKKGEF